MGRKTGREMRSLMLAVSISMLLLVLAIIAYFMVDIITTTNNNIEHNKEMMIDQSVLTLEEMAENIAEMPTNPNMGRLFSEELIEEVMAGDIDILYSLMVDLSLAFYPVDYVGIVRGGEVVAYDTRTGVVIDQKEMPTEPSEEGYETRARLGEKEGFFISVFYPVDLSILGLEVMEVNFIVDRTAELAEIESYFTDQRNDLVLRLSIASVIAIILTILLTTFGLRHFTRKYVVKPIEELNHTAEEIAEGTFEGDVKVDEASAYATLQGLLRSGQKVLRRMDQELK